MSECPRDNNCFSCGDKGTSFCPYEEEIINESVNIWIDRQAKGITNGDSLIMPKGFPTTTFPNIKKCDRE